MIAQPPKKCISKVIEIIAGGENDRTEFKSSLSEEREILETICGFSNTAGGVLLIGVDVGNGTMEGLINKIKFSIEPTIIPQIEVVNFDSKKV